MARKISDLGVRAVALHRPPRPDEVKGLAALARRLEIVAIFCDEPARALGPALRVVDGGPAAADREGSLEALCRRLHAWRPLAVALRTPPDADHHPAPGEIALVHEAVPHVGYWHDAERGNGAFLEAAGARLRGASFHPLTDTDLVSIRQALPAHAPAVVACPAGAAKEEVAEALRCARGIFRA